MTFEGIIFDCDGTLADTMPLHWEAWRTVAERHGFHFPEERFYALGGVPSRDILQQINEEQNLALDTLRVSKEKEEAYLPRLKEARVVDPVVEVAFPITAKCRWRSPPAGRARSFPKFFLI